MPINRLELSHSSNSDQMLPININGVNRTANRKVLSQNKCMIHDIIGCNKESCDRNNGKECQILDECKTIKTKHLLVKLFRCDQGDALGDIRLKNREDMHAGNKRYKCGKERRQRQNLQRHIRTHTGDKSYKCDVPVCDKGLMWNQSLQ